MYETPDDLRALQALLDASYERAGQHLRSIVTPERRLDAATLAARLTGMRLLTLATTTADGRPLAGAVDGLFYRGAFWFGSAPTSLRFRHIRARPWVSAVHVEGEPFGVTVHGRAHEVALRAPEHAGFWDYCREIYGAAWDDWTADSAAYARIDGDRMYTYALETPARGD